MKNNNKNYNSIIKDWQNSISYIPQTMFISNDTIKNNIAYGTNKQKINNELINDLIDKTLLREVVNSLEEKENTVVGESGILLSGGQRQRLAIARALYSDKEVLILDEATNALDPITENLILKAMINHKQDLTILIVSHNPKSLQHCDRIIQIKDKQIIYDGPNKNF